MNYYGGELEAYIQQHTSPEPSQLAELNRATNVKVSKPQMLSGHFQGLLLKMFSMMMQPHQILEVGTYTGYSAICLAAGLQEGGLLHTIDNNEELEPMIRNYFHKAGVAEQVALYIDNALEVIPKLDYSFDMVFIDADKVNYSKYYDLVFDKVRTGGLIIADNVLWSGKVVEPNPDQDTQAIMAYNDKVNEDERVENLLLPVRDGLMLAYKC